MKRPNNIIFAIVLLLMLLLLSAVLSAQTANKNASANTKKIFLYLQNLSKSNAKRVISGHMINSALLPKPSFDSSAQKIFNKTGKWVGILGIDYQRNPIGLPSNIDECNQVAIDYFGKGGLIAIMSSFSNPWNAAGNSNDTTNRSRLLEIITPGNSAYQKFHAQLDSVAKGLLQLQESGVTVFYRLFHEHNAPWFWWGSSSLTRPTKKEWDSVWVYVFHYFTEKKGLNNILWVFSPSAKTAAASNPAFKRDDYYYPGSEYVDIVGVDVYNDTLDIPYYNDLKVLGKPLALCEFGMQLERAKTPFNYDYRILLDQIKRKHPEIVYWMSWNDFGGSKGNVYYGMTNQNYVSELLSDPWVINRGEINWNYSTRVNNDLAVSGFKLFQNYPNPFNPSTVISYEIPTAGHVVLKVYDILGREVVTLADGFKQAGVHTANYRANDNVESSGIYFYRLETGNFINTKKMLLIR